MLLMQFVIVVMNFQMPVCTAHQQ